ncbi:hypothetical protein GOP47_0015511 [Adiantum capillus-veneris]|uniref:Uncharacterized protein n=1 Tax=Adiantum capillus-veneris TaxID=13818 RepID=A0A9D4UJW5_ADICA|nr:hypothetical protein GOP47_0015511 [Adiantum capillus-veneris]
MLLLPPRGLFTKGRARNFTRFSYESYRGNTALCGKKIGLLCGPYTAPSNGMKSKSVFIGLGLSVAICLLALLAYLWKANHQSEKKELGNQGLAKFKTRHEESQNYLFNFKILLLL